ncbi:MAG: DMT family transporter [bacterium]
MISRINLAIGAVLLSGFTISFGDAMVKFLGSEVSLWQLIFLRSLLIVVGLCAIILCAAGKSAVGGFAFRPCSIFWVVVRSFTLAMFLLCAYIGLARMNFALVAAVIYTYPIFVLLLMPLFGGAPARGKSWTAIGLAFVGVLLIVRPTHGNFNIFILFSIAAAIFYALSMLITNTKLTNENSKLVALWQNTALMIFGAVGCAGIQIIQPDFAAEDLFYFGAWQSLTYSQWGTMLVLAAAQLISAIAVVVAYQNGPAATIATVDYCYVLFSLLWGWVILSEAPAFLDLVGIAVIAVAGIMIAKTGACNAPAQS